MPLITNGPEPVFRTVKPKAALVVLTTWFPNPWELGVTDMAGTSPVNATDPLAAGARTLTFNCAVLAVEPENNGGANVSVMLQVPPAATPAPPIGQVLLVMWN